MTRYIDADTFLKSVKQKAYPQSGIVNESERKISLFGIMEILTSMPTADVQEVVHGEWIAGKEIAREFLGDTTLHIDYEDYKCSVCGLTLDRLLYCVDGSLFYKYCPNCGAKMDGVHGTKN